jgi:hypothetical protein
MAMTTLNITYNGMSADVPVELDGHVPDTDVRRIALDLPAPQGPVRRERVAHPGHLK